MASLRQITRTVPRLSSVLKVQSAQYQTDPIPVLGEGNTTQNYTSDGEKIYCGYTVVKGEREETGTVESARARAFDESINNVIQLKFDDTRDGSCSQ